MRRSIAAFIALVGLLKGVSMSAEPSIRQVREGKDATAASIRIRGDAISPHAIPSFITGKFAEHLGRNIYNGMDAQILRNPTFADHPFWTGQMTPDGVTRFHSDESKIAEELRRQASRSGWPAGEIDRLIEGRSDALACWWVRQGPREAVRVSPDAGPHGGRAQRVQVQAAGQGVAQWTVLPLHRAGRYEVEVFARSPDLAGLTVSLWQEGKETPVAKAALAGLADSWSKLTGSLTLDPSCPPDGLYRLAVTADGPGQFILRYVLLRPADHVGGADPDVVRLLRESHLPILRWPGGNFVSGYHWEDGVGTPEARPTRPNYAWGGVEANLFGTDEFIAFCRSVGCEPMICINAGDGTPQEAARWVEYCNGAASSPMGARRAANGHPEPYRIRHWEVGNELWGRWQFHWTTAEGYVDRYRRFAKAMLAADPEIRLYACGAPVFWGKAWNNTLIAGLGKDLQRTTDHPLIGGQVGPQADPLDVYRDFMAVPEVLQAKWAALRQDMARAGVAEPRLAVTELQMFARVGAAADDKAPPRLTHENLVNPGKHAEGLYDVLIYHAAVRLAPFVEMVTHSATVNHGGGLRKERERVYANPCHHAQAMFAAFAAARPVAVVVDTPFETAPRVLPDLRNAAPQEVRYGAIDALAALARDGSLLVSVVHRGTAGPIRLTVAVDGLRPAGQAEIRTLSADVPWAANTLAAPDAVRPADSTAEVRDGKLQLDTIRPYTFVRLRIPKAQ